MLYCSKNDIDFLIGATSDFNNYSVGNTKLGLSWLLTNAKQRIPALSNSHIIKQWSGIRPYTKHEIPIMDQLDDGLFIITGHYRNGILLSPIIGRDIANWLLSGIKPLSYESFSISRVKIMKCIINGEYFTFDYEDSIAQILKH